MTMTSLGTINMQSTSTQSFVIPTTVPATAREVLVYVYVIMGTSQDIFFQHEDIHRVQSDQTI